MKPRHVLWTQAGLLVYSVGTIRLFSSGLVDFWTYGPEGMTYTPTGHAIGGIAAYSMFASFWIFPPVVLMLVPWRKRPRETAISVLAECVLWLGNGFALTVVCSH